MLAGISQSFSSCCFLKPKISWSPPKDNRVAADVEILSLWCFWFWSGGAGRVRRYGVRCFRWCWSISSLLLLYSERELSQSVMPGRLSLSLSPLLWRHSPTRPPESSPRPLWLHYYYFFSAPSRFFFFLQTFHSIHSNSQNTPTNPRTVRALHCQAAEKMSHSNESTLIMPFWTKLDRNIQSVLEVRPASQPARPGQAQRSTEKRRKNNFEGGCVLHTAEPSTLSHLQKC